LAARAEDTNDNASFDRSTDDNASFDRSTRNDNAKNFKKVSPVRKISFPLLSDKETSFFSRHLFPNELKALREIKREARKRRERKKERERERGRKKEREKERE
jgi:hypothetical protein